MPKRFLWAPFFRSPLLFFVLTSRLSFHTPPDRDKDLDVTGARQAQRDSRVPRGWGRDTACPQTMQATVLSFCLPIKADVYLSLCLSCLQPESTAYMCQTQQGHFPLLEK